MLARVRRGGAGPGVWWDPARKAGRANPPPSLPGANSTTATRRRHQTPPNLPCQIQKAVLIPRVLPQQPTTSGGPAFPSLEAPSRQQLSQRWQGGEALRPLCHELPLVPNHSNLHPKIALENFCTDIKEWKGGLKERRGGVEMALSNQLPNPEP